MEVLPALRSQLDRYLAACNGQRHRYLAGLSTQLSLCAAHEAFPIFSDPASFFALHERYLASGTSEAQRPLMLPWMRFLWEQLLDAKSAVPQEEIAALEAQQRPVLSEEESPWREVEVKLVREPSAERRALMEAAQANFLLAHKGPYARRRERSHAALALIHCSSFRELRQRLEVEETPAADCEALLKSTDDAYADLLCFYLKRLDPSLKSLPHGRAGLWDLKRVAQTPWLASLLAPGESLPALDRCLTALGFHPTAEGYVQREVHERVGKTASAQPLPIGVPEEIRLLCRIQTGGHAEYFGLFRASAEALRLGHLPGDSRVETRRLGDPTALQAWGLVFGQLLTCEGFYRRFLTLSKPMAREIARVSAFLCLAGFREAVGRRLCADAAESDAPSGTLADSFVQRTQSALRVTVSRGRFLQDAWPLQRPHQELQAWALAALITQKLERDFQEDFFRNPACGTWLKQQWRSPEREDAGTVAKQLSETPPSLAEAAARLIRVMGA